MPIALWCVLIAAIIPLVLVGFAKTEKGYDNARPRDSALKFGGWRARAYAAHQNGFEAFPFFAAAVIVAEMRSGPTHLANWLAGAFILARLAHAAAYVGDQAALRSTVWTIGFLLTIAIFLSPLWQ
jgi:uncharacterized MAPEG superfamily protein